jgi:hypothetical protein
VIRTAQQRGAIIQKPLRRQSNKTRHRQSGVARQLHKLLPLLRRNTNLNAIIKHARNLRTYKNRATHTKLSVRAIPQAINRRTDSAIGPFGIAEAESFSEMPMPKGFPKSKLRRCNGESNRMPAADRSKA